MSTKPNVLVLTGFGLNCDHETAYAFELAGATAKRAHINALIAGDVRLDDFQILAFGGGFSWGDDHGAGVIQALRLKTNIGDKLLDFVAAHKLVIGICNGFQTLVNLGLLPGIDGDYTRRSVALTYNDCGNFRDQWVRLKIDPDSPCVFTRGIKTLELPVRHGEGKFYAESETLPHWRTTVRSSCSTPCRTANRPTAPSRTTPTDPGWTLPASATPADASLA
jgi:phosphoribosylformylglycinamidine (FGAM) synthase-like amidotransferase family enzyme